MSLSSASERFAAVVVPNAGSSDESGSDLSGAGRPWSAPVVVSAQSGNKNTPPRNRPQNKKSVFKGEQLF
eukprot:9481928-Pyramimonas_sp.AAC.2